MKHTETNLVSFEIVYDDKTPVIVADLSHHQAGELFGISKVNGGNKYTTIHMRSMCVILYSKDKKARVWVTV